MPTGAPDPDDVADLAEFIGAMRRLRVWAGSPSYRTMAKQVGPLLRPPRTLAQSTLADAFLPGRRRLDMDLLTGIVRVLGVDEADVARWRQACVRVQAEAKAGGLSGVLRQLPADLPTFTGRERELTDLIDHATRTDAGSGARYEAKAVVVSIIEGMAGVGKTRLAVHAAHRLVRAGHYADVQLYANLRGFDPVLPPADPAVVLDGFLRALGVPGSAVPDGLDERAAMFRDRLHGQNALLLLDNAAGSDQVRHLIPSSTTCFVLITSRRTLIETEGAGLLLLDTFSSSEAVGLLAAVGGPERVLSEPEAAERVADLCGRLPIAIALAAARLRSRPAWTVAELVRRLEAGGVDAVAIGDRSLHAAFSLSYQGLSAPAQRLFALLGTHPGTDFTVPDVAALTGTPWPEIGRMLEALQDEHLVEQTSVGRYGLHDLLRGYAAEKAAQRDDAEAAVHRLLMFYLDSADRADRRMTPVAQPLERVLPEGCRPIEFADRDQALSWFAAEYDNLLASLRTAAAGGYHDIAAELPIMMGGYFDLRADSQAWIAALRIAMAGATELGGAARLGGALNRLGMALIVGGRHEEAADALARAAELGRPLEDGRLWRTARTNLAVVLERLGRLHEAETLLHEVLPDQRRMGGPIGVGVVLECLGKISLRTGNHTAAIDYCEQAIASYEQAERDHEISSALNIIGQAHHDAGRLSEAEDSHRRALERAVALDSRRNQGHSLHQLGLTLRDKGDTAAAADCLRRAIDAYSAVGDPRAAEAAELLGTE